ncbi:MAG: tetratricopeptide repeat protein [Planctomycetota bacterium]|nr:tetratricopeptide repeat protein [Planctomycetota bacterium]
MKCAAAILLFLSLGAAHAQVPPAPSVVRGEKPLDARKVALARDPATLPHAAAERWKDFDPKQVTPDSLPREFLQVRQALSGGDLPAAVSHLLDLLQREPDYPPALHQLGVTYFQLQRYGDARTCFERYLVVAPQRVGDTRGLAHTLYSLGRYEDALAHYERVLAAAPADVEALRGRALARYRLGDVAGALADLTRVLEREPEHADAWTWKSQVLLDLDQADAARAAAEKARDLAPWSPRPWFALSAALTDLGLEKEARAARERFQLLSSSDQEIRRLEAHLEHEPGDFRARRDLVNAQAEVGDRRSVRLNLARLLAERPEDAALRIFALDICDRIGDVEAGRLAARDLERVGADSAAAWKRLEAWYGARRDRAKQIEAGERWRRASQP